MIKILFYGGTHGNFLEFVLNKLYYGDKIERSNPFTTGGTSHLQRSDPNYQKYRFFKCHQVNVSEELMPNVPSIKIDFEESDDITVLQLHLKRAEDYNIDPDTLTENTYHKLSGKFGCDGPEGNGPNKMISYINQYSDISPYYNIKDSNWPDIQSIDDFYNLPQVIRDECRDIFGFEPFYLCDKYPNAPRSVLVSFFKIWFETQKTPYHHMRPFDQLQNLYKIPLRSLYDFDLFSKEIYNISKFFNLNLPTAQPFRSLHQKFRDAVPYLDSRQKCHRIVDAVINDVDIEVSLNVIEESYVLWKLESLLGQKITHISNEGFTSTRNLITWIKNHTMIPVDQ